MKINEKNLASFATCSSPVDKEGYLSKKGDVKGYQRRWFVLKGNLLFYFDKKQDKEPSGLIVLESCSVQASPGEKHGFEISFDGSGTRTYLLVADNDEEMQSWMRAVSHASYEYLKSIVIELQRQVDTITSRSVPEQQQQHAGARTRESIADKRIPTVAKPKTRIENGIVVDVEEAPPIPSKQCKKQSQSNLDSSVHRAPAYSHASPVVPPVTTSKPLSPPGTLDRTPTLSPTVVTSPSETQQLIDLTDMDYDTPPPPVPQKQQHQAATTSSSDLFIDQPSSHSSAVMKKLAASSADHTKTVYEMHQGFSEAMAALKNERTQHNIS